MMVDRQGSYSTGANPSDHSTYHVMHASVGMTTDRIDSKVKKCIRLHVTVNIMYEMHECIMYVHDNVTF